MIGDHLRTRMVLYGHPKCINTAKCLQTAAEKGVDIETRVLDANGGMDSAEMKRLSPLGIAPILQDVDFVIYGTRAILSYLDDKGFGPSLVPRNGVVRAVMYQVAGAVSNVVQTKIAADDAKGVESALKNLSEQLAAPKKGDYICGEFSFADIHWTACLNMLTVKGHGDMLNKYRNIQEWFDLVKQHPSTSKEKIIPYTVVPTAEDMQNNKLRDIEINV